MLNPPLVLFWSVLVYGAQNRSTVTKGYCSGRRPRSQPCFFLLVVGLTNPEQKLCAVLSVSAEWEACQAESRKLDAQRMV